MDLIGAVIGVYLVVCTLPFSWESTFYFGFRMSVVYPRFYRATYWFPVLIVCALNGLMIGLMWTEESATRALGLGIGTIGLVLSGWALCVTPEIVYKQAEAWQVRDFRDLNWGKRWAFGSASAAVMILALIVAGLGGPR